MKKAVLILTMLVAGANALAFTDAEEKGIANSGCHVVTAEIEAEAQYRANMAIKDVVAQLPESYQDYVANLEKTEGRSPSFDEIYDQVAEERKLDLNKYCQ